MGTPHIHSFHQYSLRTYRVPDVVPGAWDASVNKTNTLAFGGLNTYVPLSVGRHPNFKNNTHALFANSGQLGATAAV